MRPNAERTDEWRYEGANGRTLPEVKGISIAQQPYKGGQPTTHIPAPHHYWDMEIGGD